MHLDAQPRGEDAGGPAVGRGRGRRRRGPQERAAPARAERSARAPAPGQLAYSGVT